MADQAAPSSRSPAVAPTACTPRGLAPARFCSRPATADRETPPWSQPPALDPRILFSLRFTTR
uniref:Uncharacterized protein n=1 Tax=Arundo donax TaxID=35708 RepID=A0A0A9EJE9_ARUDO